MGTDGIGAMLRRDGETLEAVTGLQWPDDPPPALADHLVQIYDALLATPEDAAWWTWSIAMNGERQACGGVGLNGPPDGDGIVWIGYALYPEARGQGLATDAVTALIGWAFGDERVRVVLASIAPDNLKSQDVAERAGMRFHQRSARSALYRQTRGQWPAQNIS